MWLFVCACVSYGGCGALVEHVLDITCTPHINYRLQCTHHIILCVGIYTHMPLCTLSKSHLITGSHNTLHNHHICLILNTRTFQGTKCQSTGRLAFFFFFLLSASFFTCARHQVLSLYAASLALKNVDHYQVELELWCELRILCIVSNAVWLYQLFLCPCP